MHQEAGRAATARSRTAQASARFADLDAHKDRSDLLNLFERVQAACDGFRGSGGLESGLVMPGPSHRGGGTGGGGVLSSAATIAAHPSGWAIWSRSR